MEAKLTIEPGQQVRGRPTAFWPGEAIPTPLRSQSPRGVFLVLALAAVHWEDMADDKLTSQQRRFVEAYTGNATEAAIKAGYSRDTAEAQGSRLLRNVKVATAIRSREAKAIRPLIANREARQRFWTDVMEDKAVKMPDRLKASELLAKSEGDFFDRVEHSGGVTLTSLFQQAKAQGGSDDGDA